jgi:hypothetical protein
MKKSETVVVKPTKATKPRAKPVKAPPAPEPVAPTPEPIPADEEPEVVAQETSDSGFKVSKRDTPMTSNEFSKKLKDITDAISHLAVLEDTMSQLPKGSVIRYKDDIQIHRRDITSFRTTIKNEVSELRKTYDTALKYRKKLKPENHRVVRFLRKLNPVARELLCSSSSGLGKYNGEELHTLLPLFAKDGYILNTTIMYLTSIFTRKNKLKSGGSSLKATDGMRRLLSPYASDLESKGFKFDDFNTTRWTTIVSILKEDISKEDRDAVMKSEYDQLLGEEEVARKVLDNLK